MRPLIGIMSIPSKEDLQEKIAAWLNLICPKVAFFKLVQWPRSIVTVYQNRSSGENGNLWGTEKCYHVLNHAKRTVNFACEVHAEQKPSSLIVEPKGERVKADYFRG